VSKLTKVAFTQASVVVGVAVAIFLFVTWGVWVLWCSVMPYFWVLGPLEFTDPAYWRFAGAILLGHMVVKLLGLKK
jgi:hypothetical protein